MKKANKFFMYALCILLSSVIACTALIVGASDSGAGTTLAGEVSDEISTTKDLIYRPPTQTTEKDITDTISEFVSEKGWEDELSSFGEDISEKSEEAENFLTRFLQKLESIIETISQYLKQIFKISSFD